MKGIAYVWGTLSNVQMSLVVALMLVIAFVSLGIGMFIGVKIAPQTGHQRPIVRHQQAPQHREMVAPQFRSLTPQVDITRVRTHGYGKEPSKAQKYFDRHR